MMGEPIRGRDGIRSYWQTKVVGGQANITCDLLNLYLDDGTAIAEWQAEFDDTAQQVRKRMREVALLTFDGPLIASLREYLTTTAPARGAREPTLQPDPTGRPLSEAQQSEHTLKSNTEASRRTSNWAPAQRPA
jgi:hypothetical protein